MTIQVCIGSSCHVRGSYEIKTILEELIRQNGLENQVVLRPAFCLGVCVRGDGQTLSGVTAENAAAIFRQYVLKG